MPLATCYWRGYFLNFPIIVMQPSLSTQKISVHAYAIADTIPLRTFSASLGAEVKEVQASKTHRIFHYDKEQYLVAHDFGAIVFFDVPQSERERVLGVLYSVVGPESRPASVEDFSIAVSADARPTAQFNCIVVDQFSPRLAELVALVIGQSAAMEYYENDMDRILARIDAIANDLAKHGRAKSSIRRLTRFIGEGMQLRNRVIFTLALLDAPALTWDDEVLDRVYRELRAVFSIEDRYRALDHKLSMIRDNLELIVDLTQSKRSLFLEVGVVLLIALEIVLILYK